jgi:hypothetical protein
MTTSPSFCASCGKALSPNAAFCEACGKPVGSTAPAAPKPASNKKWIPILIAVGGIACLGCVVLAVLGIVFYNLAVSQRTAQTGPGVQPYPAAPTFVVPTLAVPEDPAPTADLGALAATFVSIDFDPSTCKQDSIGSYNFRGTVTNTSDYYSLANIVLGGKLIDADENVVQWGIGSPDAVILRPGKTVDLWFWIDWYHLDGFRCETYLRSAELADQ